MLKIGKIIDFLIIFWFLFYFLIFGLLLRNSYDYLDPDLGWHLKVGEEIATNKQVPTENFYNYTFSGDWVNHEWLIDWFSWQVYDNFGYLTISIIFALIIVASLIILTLFTRKFFKPISIIPLAIFQFFGLLACLPSFGVRMQEFSFLFLLLELFIIQKFVTTRSIRPLFFLLPLFYFWANIHGSFLFGLTILAVFLLVKIVETVILKTKINKYFLKENILSKREILFFGLFIVLTFSATLLTPYKLGLYSFLESYRNTAYLKIIQEWLPFYYLPVAYSKLIYLAFLVSAWLIYIYESYRNKLARIDLWQFILFILFFILALQARRNFPLAFVATFPFFIKILTELVDFEKIKNNTRKELRYFLIICLTLTGVSVYLSCQFKLNPFTSFCEKYPCQAKEFLKNEPEYKDYNIFNEYGWGGYLIFTYPEKRLFIDGRLPQAKFAGHTFIEEYLDFFKPNSDHGSKLAQYDIRLVLLKTKDDELNLKKWEKLFFRIDSNSLKSVNHLRSYLDNSLEWKIVYRDLVASVYVKEE